MYVCLSLYIVHFQQLAMVPLQCHKFVFRYMNLLNFALFRMIYLFNQIYRERHLRSTEAANFHSFQVAFLKIRRLHDELMNMFRFPRAESSRK